MALCRLKQGAFKPAKDYYECMAMLVITLQECHGAQFQEGELVGWQRTASMPGSGPHGPS